MLRHWYCRNVWGYFNINQYRWHGYDSEHLELKVPNKDPVRSWLTMQGQMQLIRLTDWRQLNVSIHATDAQFWEWRTNNSYSGVLEYQKRDDDDDGSHNNLTHPIVKTGLGGGRFGFPVPLQFSVNNDIINRLVNYPLTFTALLIDNQLLTFRNVSGYGFLKWKGQPSFSLLVIKWLPKNDFHKGWETFDFLFFIIFIFFFLLKIRNWSVECRVSNETRRVKQSAANSGRQGTQKQQATRINLASWIIHYSRNIPTRLTMASLGISMRVWWGFDGGAFKKLADEVEGEVTILRGPPARQHGTDHCWLCG